MNYYPSVTGYIKRTGAFIAHFLHLEEQNERVIASSVLALPAPKNATAATWERDAPICEKHHTPNFRSLVVTDTLKFGEYYCSQCEQEHAEERIFQLHTSKIHALFPEPGQLSRRLLSEVRRNLQEDAVKDIIASLSTRRKNKAVESAQRPTTGPLPARDIERASSPQPHTPLPPTRADLFADVPHETIYTEDDETTERRPRVHKSTDTIQIPAMDAEALLLDIMHGKTHAQSTGENERLVVESNAWML